MNDKFTSEQIIKQAAVMGKKVLLLPALPEIGADNATRLAERLEELPSRGKAAWQNKAYMEYISLLLLYLEVFLRVFLLGKKAYTGLDMTKDKKTFGEIVDLCGKAGFDKGLLKRLHQLNQVRRTYIHKYILYGGAYEDIETHYESLSKLPVDTTNYIFKEIAVNVTDASQLGKPVEMCFIRWTTNKGMHSEPKSHTEEVSQT